MLILLPPSEGKAAAPRRGRPLDLDGLSWGPELGPARRAALEALVRTSGRDDALAVLRAPRGATDAVCANTSLHERPTVRVGELYTGVLYEALGLATLDAAARRRANRRLVVVSALFGAVRPADRVPPYRLSIDVDLPGVGPLAAHWRSVLGPVLTTAAGRGVVVDCRSSTYATAWRPNGPLADRTVAVQVVREGPGGRTAVSHMAKHTRGKVARHLLVSGAEPRRAEEVVEALAPAFRARLVHGRHGTVRRLEVVEPA